MNPHLDDKSNPWLVLQLKTDIPTDLKCLIDTGFSGGLALPKYYEKFLSNKIPISSENYEFANGEQQIFPVYSTTVKFNKRNYDTKVMFIDNGVPLVGISFLKYFKFFLSIKERVIKLDRV